MALKTKKSRVIAAIKSVLSSLVAIPLVLVRAFNYNTVNKVATLTMKLLVIQALLITIQLAHTYFDAGKSMEFNSDVTVTHMTDAGVGFINPIIRILSTDNKFICSASVISDEYAITAAHCVVDKSGNLRKKSHIGNTETTHIIIAETVGLNNRLDYAVIKGNFVEFKKLKINENSSFLVAHLYTPATYKSCGYPQGIRELFCSPFLPTGAVNFQVSGQAALYPGMSGGPVINETTGEVVGINSAVSGDSSFVAPVIGILSNFGIR